MLLDYRTGGAVVCHTPIESILLKVRNIGQNSLSSHVALQHHLQAIEGPECRTTSHETKGRGLRRLLPEAISNARLTVDTGTTAPSLFSSLPRLSCGLCGPL